MKIKKWLWVLTLAFVLPARLPAEILVPMDLTQNDHLKAYGLAYKVLKAGVNVEWLLNYRGGSFLFEDRDVFRNQARLMGVSFETVGPDQVIPIHQQIKNSNMEVQILDQEKAGSTVFRIFSVFR